MPPIVGEAVVEKVVAFWDWMRALTVPALGDAEDEDAAAPWTVEDEAAADAADEDELAEVVVVKVTVTVWLPLVTVDVTVVLVWAIAAPARKREAATKNFIVTKDYPENESVYGIWTRLAYRGHEVRNGRVLSDRRERGLHLMDRIVVYVLRTLTAFRQSYSLVPALFDFLNLRRAEVWMCRSSEERRMGFGAI